jgi:hypothetical protein
VALKEDGAARRNCNVRSVDGSERMPSSAHRRSTLLACAALLVLATACAAWSGPSPAAPGRAPVSAPSGQAMPTDPGTGWRRAFADDFTVTVPTGSFPPAVSSRWKAYRDGWPDTSGNGRYMPSKVLSQHDGVLDLFVHTENGVPMVSAPLPIVPGAPGSEGGLVAGRYTVRFRSDVLPGYKTAWLLWPDSERWPADGEIDFPEARLDGSDTITGFMHRQGGSGQDAYDSGVVEAGTGWHTATIEWKPGWCRFVLDGRVLGTSTSAVPDTPMHFVLQTETYTSGPPPSPTVAGHVLVDWITIDVPTG